MKNTKKEDIQHIWTLVAGSSAVDINSNSLSIFNIIEEINVTLPKDTSDTQSIVVPITFEVISLWEKVSEDMLAEVVQNDVKIEMYAPSSQKKPVAEFLYTLQIPENKKRMRFRFGVNGVKLEGEGGYMLKVSLKKETTFVSVAEYPILVNINKQ